MNYETILASTVIAAIVSALISWWNGERKIAIENITKERAKWRDKIRELTIESVEALQNSDNAKLVIIKSAFKLNLNPKDKEDQAIVNLINLNETLNGSEIEELTTRISLLLKHDWERAKRESKPFVLRWKRVKRLKYEDFIKSNNR
jgi:hypothetical protein